MKVFLAVSLLASTAFATELRQVELTAECESRIENEALRSETQELARQGETLASSLKAEAYLSYWPAKDGVNVTVQVEDPADGRSIAYTAKVSKDDVESCKIAVSRRSETACRYSTYDGPDGLNNIAGLKFTSGDDIVPEDKLSDLTNDQIAAFLGESDPTANIPDLIRGTDDESLSTGVATLPGGRTLTYFGAYGGDNPFGIFFEENTTTSAGTNSDGSICINPAAK